jgi:hypothetical protein
LNRHLFIAGVPATGKSWLGSWLEQTQGYVHIDAERNGGVDFDRAGIHNEWNDLVETGSAKSLTDAIDQVGKAVVINWGFPTRFLYVVSALQAEGIHAWWFHADRTQARAAFVARGGIDPRCFDKQMDDIAREWSLLSLVFQSRVIVGLTSEGAQRKPEELWAEVRAAG